MKINKTSGACIKKKKKYNRISPTGRGNVCSSAGAGALLGHGHCTIVTAAASSWQWGFALLETDGAGMWTSDCNLVNKG